MTVYVSPEDLILLVALIGYTTWWAADLRKGSRVRRWSLGLHLVVYGLAAFYVWAVSLGEIGIAGAASSPLSWVWTLVLTTVAVVGVEAGLWYGRRRVVVERTETGTWRYRGPINIALFWLSLYLLRFTLEDGLLGGYSVFLPMGSAPSGIPLGTFVAVVLLVASIYLLSFGFMLGISIDLWMRHGTARKTPVSPAGAPGSPAPPPTASTKYVMPPTLELQLPRSTFSTTIAGAHAGFAPLLPSIADGNGGMTPRTASIDATACPRCGAGREPVDRFCGNCGGPFGEVPPRAVPAPRGGLVDVPTPSTQVGHGPLAASSEPMLAVHEFHGGGDLSLRSHGGVSDESITLGPAPTPVCPRCQRSIAAEDRFCGECGAPQVKLSAEPNPPGSATANRTPGTFCAACDQPIGSNDRFCGSCGKPRLRVST